MKKSLYILTLFFFTILNFAQENKDKISITFENDSKQAVIDKIESKTKYKFYYEEVWLKKDSTLITKTFQNANINDVLEHVFEKTELNYFVQNNKIILTQNIVIYDKLSENYLEIITKDNNQITEKIVDKPVFYKQYDSIAEIKKTNPVVLIGKETKESNKKPNQLSGYIKDSKSGIPLANITVRVKKDNRSTITDSNGYYSIILSPGVNYVEIDAINYAKLTQKVAIYNTGKLDINLDEKVNLLKEVVINLKQNDKTKSTVTGLTTIDIESIKNVPLILGERDIFRVAAALPGIKTTGEGSAGYNVRGGKEDQNLILLDNAVIYNPAHFFGFFSAVNPFTTKKANIYKGSIPAEFGGRLSSVFDITTKNANTEKLTGEAGVGPVTSNLSIGTPIVKGKSSLLFGARATYSGWILKSLNEESLKNSEASFYDGIVKYNHNINKNNIIEATAYLSRDVFSISSDSLYKYSNKLISLKWDHKINEKNRGALIFTNSDYKFNIDYRGDKTKSFDFGYTINESQAQIKMNHLLNEKHTINYGIASKLYNISPGNISPSNSESIIESLSIQKERALESAIYVNDNFKVSEKLLVDFGVRFSTFSALGKSNQRVYQSGVPLNDATVIETKQYDKNEIIKTYTGFEPRVAARYFLADDFSVKASYDKTNQYIHLLSSNTTQAPTDTWKLSDLNVKPSVAEQFSIGFFKNLNKNNLELSIEGYYKKSKNILDYKVAAQLLLNENIETELLQGEGKSYGIEVLLKKDLGRLNGWIGYTYSRSFIKLDSKFNEERVNNGEFFASNFDKPHDVSVVLNYRFTKRYSISSNFVYQTGRPITFPIGTYTYGNAEYTLYSDRNKFRIPDYYRLDIGFNVEGNHKLKKLAHSFWNFSIYNVLGRNNPYSIYFVTDNGKIKAYKTSIFAIPVPTVTYNFKF